MSDEYAAVHDPETGRFLGVRRADGAHVPPDPRNADWRAFLGWNAAAVPPVDTADRPPPTAAELLARARLKALTEFGGRADDTAIAIRLLIDAVCTLSNDRFQALGQGRPLTLPNLLAYVAANPTAGDPLPAPGPG